MQLWLERNAKRAYSLRLRRGRLLRNVMVSAMRLCGVGMGMMKLDWTYWQVFLPIVVLLAKKGSRNA